MCKATPFFVVIVFIACVEYDGKQTADTSSRDHREVS